MKKKGKGKKSLQKIPKMENLKQINLNAAGIDIGSGEIHVCVPEDRDEQPVKRFGTFTCDLHTMANWLKWCNITTVAMESTVFIGYPYTKSWLIKDLK